MRKIKARSGAMAAMSVNQLQIRPRRDVGPVVGLSTAKTMWKQALRNAAEGDLADLAPGRGLPIEMDALVAFLRAA